MKLTKTQQKALIQLYLNPTAPRTKFKDRTWLSLCAKGLANAQGFLAYSYLAPKLSADGYSLAKTLASKGN